jgi:hypothetical protein
VAQSEKFCRSNYITRSDDWGQQISGINSLLALQRVDTLFCEGGYSIKSLMAEAEKYGISLSSLYIRDMAISAPRLKTTQGGKIKLVGRAPTPSQALVL